MGESNLSQYYIQKKVGWNQWPFKYMTFRQLSPGLHQLQPKSFYQKNDLFISNSILSRKMKKAAFDNLLAIDFSATTRFVFCNFR